jgi:hypothetical protein
MRSREWFVIFCWISQPLSSSETSTTRFVVFRVFQSNGSLLNPVSGLCMDTDAGAASQAGDRLYLQPCTGGKAAKPNTFSYNSKVRQLRSPF